MNDYSKKQLSKVMIKGFKSIEKWELEGELGTSMLLCFFLIEKVRNKS